MASSVKVTQRMDDRIDELSRNFEHYVGVFENSAIFGGPSLYFHQKTLRSLRSYPSVADAINSDDLYDWLYATLASWGMHRMGKGNTKLRELDGIKESVRSHVQDIYALQDIRLLDIPLSGFPKISSDVWHILGDLQISIAKARIVANSKVLHHLLPILVPPIDRTYTYNFFYDRNMLSVDEEIVFGEIYSRLYRVGIKNKSIIQRLVGIRWNTSETKVIDNAVVGYVIEKLRTPAES